MNVERNRPEQIWFVLKNNNMEVVMMPFQEYERLHDLEEIFELCDRIAVIFHGEFMGILESDDPRLSDIGLMMAGSLRIDS